MKISRRELRALISEAADYGVAYNAADYIPGFERVKAGLVGMSKEVLPVRFGNDAYTKLVHEETADALRSIELVLAALNEMAVEYKDQGGMIGRLKPRSMSESYYAEDEEAGVVERNTEVRGGVLSTLAVNPTLAAGYALSSNLRGMINPVFDKGESALSSWIKRNKEDWEPILRDLGIV